MEDLVDNDHEIKNNPVEEKPEKSLLDDVVENSSEVSEDVLKDSKGNIFDPNVYMTDKEGNPRIAKKGKFKGMFIKIRKKKGKDGLNTVETEVVDETVKIQTAAHSSFEGQMLIGSFVYGESYLPKNASEKNNMVNAWKNYYTAKGVIDLPPGLALTMAVIGYHVMHTQDDVAQEKSQKIKGKIKYGILRFWEKIRTIKRKKQSHPSSRGVGNGENHAMQTAMSGSDGEGEENPST